MEYQEIKARIQELVRTNCKIMGVTPWGLEFAPGAGKKRGVLRIYIDAPGGVSVEQCAELSRQLSVVLDVEDIIPGAYNLEVSSPGLYRSFFEPQQMQDYTGEKVKIALKQAKQGRKNFTGTLHEVRDQVISIRSQDSEDIWSFDWDEINKAKLSE